METGADADPQPLEAHTLEGRHHHHHMMQHHHHHDLEAAAAAGDGGGDEQGGYDDAGTASEADLPAPRAPGGGGSGGGLALLGVPNARKEELYRELGRVLVLRCDSATGGGPPVVTMAGEDSNIYYVLERHIAPEFQLSLDRFWRLMRTELGVETWRPRVQGTQLKALNGARLAHEQHELAAVAAAVQGLGHALAPGSSPAALLQDLTITVGRIQAWWDNRTKPAAQKRGVAAGAPASNAKRRAVDAGAQLDQHSGLGAGDMAAATAAAVQAAAAAAGAGPLMDLGPDYLQTGGAGVPFQAHGFGQPGAMYGDAAAKAALAAAAAAAAAGGTATAMGGDQPAAAATAAALAAAAAAAPGTAGDADGLLGGRQPGAAGAGAGPGPGAGGQAPSSVASFLTDATGAITLDVGGRRFRTTLNTLLAVPTSLFVRMFMGDVRGSACMAQRLPSGELFIDRCGEQFHYILEYLRAVAANDLTFPLPEDARAVQEVAREAAFYQLPELLHHIQHTPLLLAPSTRTFYDMVYLETGFKDIEQPQSMMEMERAKMVMMQQLNHLVDQRSREGFAVERIEPGVERRQAEPPDDDDGGSGCQHNMFTKVLLKKVVPLLPQMAARGQQQDGGDGDNDEEADEQGQGQQGEGLYSGASLEGDSGDEQQREDDYGAAT